MDIVRIERQVLIPAPAYIHLVNERVHLFLKSILRHVVHSH